MTIEQIESKGKQVDKIFRYVVIGIVSTLTSLASAIAVTWFS